MSSSIFLKVDGITGESTESAHIGWVDVENFSWGASQPHNIDFGGGAGAGKASFTNLSVHAHIDKATPAILRYCSNGKHISSVQLSMVKAGGSQIEYSRITLEDVLITSVLYNGSTSRSMVGMSYRFQAAKVTQQYWVQSNSGNQGAESAFSWNIKSNSEC